MSKENHLKEIVRIIIEEPEVNFKFAGANVLIAVNIEGTRREIFLGLNEDYAARVVYWSDPKLTSSGVIKERSEHDFMLDISKTLRLEQVKQTANAVNREMETDKNMEDEAPVFQEIKNIITRFLFTIQSLLRFKLPFLQRAIEEEAEQKIKILHALKRISYETEKQMEIYINLLQSEKNANPELRDAVSGLLGSMEEINFNLKLLAQSFSNEAKSHYLRLKKLGLIKLPPNFDFFKAYWPLHQCESSPASSNRGP